MWSDHLQEFVQRLHQRRSVWYGKKRTGHVVFEEAFLGGELDAVSSSNGHKGSTHKVCSVMKLCIDSLHVWLSSLSFLRTSAMIVTVLCSPEVTTKPCIRVFV